MMLNALKLWGERRQRGIGQTSRPRSEKALGWWQDEGPEDGQTGAHVLSAGRSRAENREREW